MDAHIYEWLNLVIRWIHVIVGVAWIGASFYFNWLDSHLTPVKIPKKGVEGELWMVHSGGFYQVHKMKVIPDKMPETLHWFKWEAYFTWISGIALLIVVYYMGGGVFLLDSNVSNISYGGAVALGVGSVVISWFVYDRLCLSPLGDKTVPFAITGLILMAGIAFGLSQFFSSRGAYIHVGAIIGTLMAFNVWRIIIPSQEALVKATKAGTKPDEILGQRAKQRSLHNNYLTLPLLFIMVSSHFPSTYGSQFNWIMLVALSVIGAGVRHFFNLRNKGKRNVWILPVAALGMIALALVSRPETPETSSVETATPAVDFRMVKAVMALRCLQCHSAQPTDKIFVTPPKGIKFDTPEEMKKMAALIKTNVVAKTMPVGNMTKMTPDERTLISNWVDQGARIE